MLNSCFKQAVENTLINKNPLLGVKLPKADPKEIRVLSGYEQHNLIDFVKKTNNPFQYGILLCLCTGLRIGELLGLKWKDIDFSNECLNVKRILRRQSKCPENDSNYQMIEPKEENKTSLMFGNVKTFKGRRKIYLPLVALTSLREIKKFQEKLVYEYGENFNKHNLVICTVEGKPFDPRTYSDLFHKCLEKANVPYANFHSLRHTVATRALENNMDIVTLSEIMGHAQPSTTMDKYGHSLDNHKKQAMRIFNSM